MRRARLETEVALVTEQSAAPAGPPAWRRIAAAGPGLVFLAAAVGPQDLVSNASAGANYGYSFVWALGLIVLGRYIFLETTARYVMATGKSLIEGYAGLGRWPLSLALIAIVIKRHTSNLYQLLLLGITANWVVPLPFGGGPVVWSLVFWTLGFALMYFGGYRQVERWCRPLVLLLGGALAATAVLAKPSVEEIAYDLFHPSWGDAGHGISAVFVLMTLAGATAGSISNFKYAAFLHEKGWRSKANLAEQRIDLATGAAGLLVTGLLVQAAAAGALGPSAAEITDPESLIGAFAAALGETGRLMVAIGLWAATFTSYLGANTGYALLTADTWARLREVAPEDVPAGTRPAFRWALIGFIAPPLYALATDWSPLLIALLASALQLVLLPVVVVMLLRLTTDRKQMGDLVSTLR